MRQSTFFHRFGLPICLVALVSLPVMLYGAKTAFDSLTNDVADWLPDDFPETEKVHRFARHFGSDAILVVSWTGCTVNDDRLDQFREGLLGAGISTDGAPREPFFQNIFTGRDTLKQLMASPLSFPRETAIARMQGWLVGSDGTDDPPTCVVAFFTSAGWQNRHAAIEAVYDIARSTGLNRGELRLGGPAFDSVVIDLVSRESLMPLGATSVLCSLAIAWYCLRKVRFVFALFFYAVFAWSASLSAVSFSGSHMDAVLGTMPALIFVLAVSSAVHMTGYYRDAVNDVGAAQATSRAFRLGWAPCTAAAVTTAFGVGSLMISTVVPVKRFGIFAAVGVLVALVLLFALWPSSIQCLMSGRRRRSGADASDPELVADDSEPDTDESKAVDGDPEANTAVTDERDVRRSMWWLPLFRLATGHWCVILLLLAMIVPVLGYGVSRIRTSVSLTDLFSARSKIIRDYGWLESNVGPLIPVAVVLRFPEPNSEGLDEASERRQSSGAESYEYARRFRERAHLVERTRKHISEIPAVGATLAGTTFAPIPIPKIPSGRSIRATARRGVIVKRILDNRQKLVDCRYLSDDDDAELWRLSGRVGALSGLELASFLDEFEKDLNGFLANDEAAQNLKVTAEVSGGVFLVAMAQKQLLVDLKDSFLNAFVLIALAMVVLTRSFTVGLISMIPNVFPALLAFGVMGWMDVAVDIGTMMSASVALGIAVDDASHFLTWLRRGLHQGMPTIDAIRYAYQQCATAMLATSVICGLGMLVFGLSPFVPVARFACLMSVLLFAALVGNLVLLSAVLASPAGRLLGARRKELQPSNLEGS